MRFDSSQPAGARKGRMIGAALDRVSRGLLPKLRQEAARPQLVAEQFGNSLALGVMLMLRYRLAYSAIR